MELGLLEHLYHAHNAVLHMRELSLHVVAIRVRLQDLTAQSLRLRPHLYKLILLFNLCHLDYGLELVYVLVETTVSLIELIRILIHQVDISLQAAILLL